MEKLASVSLFNTRRELYDVFVRSNAIAWEPDMGTECWGSGNVGKKWGECALMSVC